MIALFIGRFQPFHRGHLQVIKKSLEKYEKILIGIGSAQYSYTYDNPFSFDERKKMINKSLSENKILNYEIIKIPDIHNYPKWVDHIMSIENNFDIVITNNKLTKTLFEEKNIKVYTPSLIKRDNYKGSVIRTRIREEKPWEELVPESVAKIIKDIDGEKRIKNIEK